MIIRNAKYLDENFVEKKGDIALDGGKILEVAQTLPYTDKDMVIDCEGFTVIPGLIDIHTHGCVGFDSSDGDKAAVLAMAQYLIGKGVTSFCPTTMTLPMACIEQAVTSIREAKDGQTEGAFIAGINLEGPFISRAKKGAQLADAIVDPDIRAFKHLYALSGNNIRLVDIAPEEDGAMDFIAEVKKFCTVSIAHTTAGYDLAKAAFSRGITHATHLYNAMTGFNHRGPGVVGAVFDTDTVFGELICDGHHIHPAVVRATFRLMGDRIVVVSDAMRLCGMEEGEIGTLGGQDVRVENGTATLSDGTIAGSITNLHDELLNLVRWGIPFPQAVRAMTLNPAKAIGMDSEIGSIQKGKKADLVVLDKQLNIVAVYHE